ncbi:MAG: serine hydrolase domain-containing protein [Bacteroidota bacterium]
MDWKPRLSQAQPAFLLTGLLFLCISASSQISSENEIFILDFMQQERIPGLSIAIIQDRQLSYTKGFGIKAKGTEEAVSKHTIFQAASISKSVTAGLVLRYVDQGKMSLDSTVRHYLTSFQLAPYKQQPNLNPTIRQLLSHTAGVNGSGFLGYRHTKKRIPDLGEFLRGKKTHPWEKKTTIKYKPGAQMKYSGGGYCVLQQALIDLEGEKFQSQFQQNLFQECGMNSSFFSAELTEEEEKNIAFGHKKNGKLLTSQYYVYPQLAAAGLWTTASDLAHYLIEIQTSFHGQTAESLWPIPLMKEMTELQVLSNGEVSHYGLGFGLYIDEDNTQTCSIRHKGANWGYTCQMYAHLYNGNGVVIMCNRNLANLDPLCEQINNWIHYEDR